MEVQQFTYMAYSCSLVDVFVSDTYMAMRCEVNVASDIVWYGYILMWEPYLEDSGIAL